MIWLVVGLAWLLKAGEDFNKSILFVPPKYQSRFVTPYWIRRAQLILYVLMYICFVLTICIPWANPYVPADSLKLRDPFWDDDLDDNWTTDDDDVALRKHRTAAGTVYKKVGFYGFYWASNGSALESTVVIYAIWSVFALMNSVLDYVKDRGKLETPDLQLMFSPACVTDSPPLSCPCPTEITKAEELKAARDLESGNELKKTVCRGRYEMAHPPSPLLALPTLYPLSSPPPHRSTMSARLLLEPQASRWARCRRPRPHRPRAISAPTSQQRLRVPVQRRQPQRKTRLRIR